MIGGLAAGLPLPSSGLDEQPPKPDVKTVEFVMPPRQEILADVDAYLEKIISSVQSSPEKREQFQFFLQMFSPADSNNPNNTRLARIARSLKRDMTL